MVAETSLVTGLVKTSNVAVFAPALTVTAEGTPAAKLPDESLTAKPELGAAAVKVTVPMAVCSGKTAVGEMLRLETRTVGRLTSSVTLSEWLEGSVAVILAEVSALTDAAFPVNEAVVAPEATVTDVGTVAIEGALDASVILRPDVPAALLSVTLPVNDAPPFTGFGERVSDESCWDHPNAAVAKVAKATMKIRGLMCITLIPAQFGARISSEVGKYVADLS
jgi:hypothetical protein